MSNKDVYRQLVSIFNVKEWTQVQSETYQNLKHYVDNYHEEYRRFELRDDKQIITTNFKDQLWYNYSRSKPIISQWINRMKLIHYAFHKDSTCLLFNLIVSFDSFLVGGCLYRNTITECVNCYIYVEKPQTLERAYLTYYVSVNAQEHSHQHKVPEFDRIYQIICLDQTLLSQFDLLSFLSEIVMYYDQSGQIGEQPIGQGITYTINQIVSRYNTHLTRLNHSVDHQIIDDQ